MAALAWYALGWGLYFALHSVLAAQGLKSRVRAHWPGAGRYYRLVYNVWAVAGLILLVAWAPEADGPPMFVLPAWVRVWCGVVAGAGAALLVLALRGYRLDEFAGLAQLDGSDYDEHHDLRQEGLNSRVRHPLYAAILLMLCGVLAYPVPPLLVAAAVALLYLPVGIVLEEKKLLEAYGEAYAAYRRKVPVLFPRLLHDNHKT